MIKRFLPIVLLAFAQLSWSQSMTDVSNVARADLRTQKSALMTEAMQLNEAQSEKFWPIYREYSNEQEKLTDTRLSKIKFFADNYDSMTDDKADMLAKEVFNMERDRTKLREKYYKKMAKALNSVLAVRFVQVDRQINTLLDMEIMQQVPLIATPEELGLTPPAE